jgi:hypothetical protein
MLAPGVDRVVRGVVVEELDVTCQGSAGEDPLEQIVAEQVVLGHPAHECCMERVDVVDALPVVAALAEQVLIDVGHRRRVRIEPRIAGEDAGEQRAPSAHQRGAHSRLYDSVARGHAPALRVEHGTVQRVGDRPH